MDREQFDAVARLVWTRQSRRAALTTLIGAAVLGPSWRLATAKPKDKDARQRKRKRKKGNPDTPRACYVGRDCQPGQGRDNSGCDFANSTRFHQIAVQGSDLSGANLAGAQLAEANLQGVDLGGACLVGANLLGAVIDASTNLEGAVFCRTLMPDGSFNDRDCGEGSRCCPAPSSCRGERCPAACIGAPNAQCSPNVPYGGCCPGLVCVPTSTTPTRFTCQAPCGEDGSCRARFGTPWECAFEPDDCRYLQGQCCQHI